MRIRLNKYLARCGVASRRKCDQLIGEGRVAVNGEITTELGRTIEDSDEVKVDGQIVKPQARIEYIVLNKPRGVVTTVLDEKDRKTVLDLVKSKARVFPVGRLDRDSSGLLLLTNDGELAYRLTHPRFKVEKVYEVCLDRPLDENDRQTLEKGVTLEEGKSAPCRIEYLRSRGRRWVRMTLRQGWKRQIRRMFSVFNYRVVELKRVGFGCLALNGLEVGAWRLLTRQEITQLKNMVGL